MAKSDFTPVIYVVQTDCLNDEDLFLKAYSLLPKERREKIDRLKYKKDKFLSLGVGILLKYALCQFDKNSDTDILYGENGKPYLRGNEFFFNASHSKNVAVCCIAPFEIGCDIEYKKNINQNIANRFFSNEEYNDIISSPDSTDKFYRYWTLKESFIKATGLGMRLPLNHFGISLKENVTVNQQVNGNKYFFKEFFELSGFACAVCGTQNCANTVLKPLDIKKIIETIN